MKKTILGFTLFILSVFTFSQKVNAEELEFVERGMGRTIVNIDDICFNEDRTLYMNKYIMMNPREKIIITIDNSIVDVRKPVTGILVSWNGSDDHDVIYAKINDGYIIQTEIKNDSDSEKIMCIEDFGISVEKSMHLTYKNFNISSNEFDTFRPYLKSDGTYTKINNYEYGFIALQGKKLDENYFKNYFKVIDHNGKETNFEVSLDEYGDMFEETGEYSILLRDNENHNGKYLSVFVVNPSEPVIDGNDKITLKTSSLLTFNLEQYLKTNYNIKGYDEKSGIYYKYDYSDYEKNKYQAGSYIVKVEAIHNKEVIASKEITVEVIDDLEPEYFVKTNVLKTSDYEQMDDYEIYCYIQNNLIDSKALNLSIIKNDYKGNESISGDYEIVYQYDLDNETHVDKLIMRVSNVKTSNDIVASQNKVDTYIIVSAIVLGISLISISLFLIIKKRRNKFN